MTEKKSSIYIIAEIGLEHCGSGAKASQLTLQAKLAGANCVKRQWFYPSEIGPVWDQVAQFVLGKESLKAHKEFCKNEGIDSLYSAFGMQSLQDLKEAEYDAVKIPSVCNEKMEMCGWANENFKKVYISTGMLNQEILILLKKQELGALLLLCTSAYPCPYDQVQLSGLSWYDGISDHTIGWEIPVAAAALGAKVIEKHLTLDKMNGGPDSKIALDPREFADMVQRIRNVELAMGDGKKKVEESEKGLLWRKSV